MNASRSKGFTGLPESGLNHGWKAQFLPKPQQREEEEQTRTTGDLRLIERLYTGDLSSTLEGP